ncbi:hypothetical protein OROMI_023043 [Orobanche minor]
MDIGRVEDQVSMTVHDYDTTALDSDGESTPYSGPDQFKDFAMNGMLRLQEDEGEYRAIKKTFLARMGFWRRVIDVVAIHKSSCSSVSGHAKLEAFRIFCQAVAIKRGGDANVNYGWYGGSRDEICDIISFGFSRCGDFEKDVSHGIGVYLSPANSSIESFGSALRAKEDENGVRHMLLCRVLLGNTETIRAGSEQLHPSSTEFDSGIDDPLEPRKFIIWSAYMNSHILPSLIISLRFRAPYLLDNSSPKVSLEMLLVALSRSLNRSKIDLVLNHVHAGLKRQMGIAELISRLKHLVGDELAAAVKFCKDQMM